MDSFGLIVLQLLQVAAMHLVPSHSASLSSHCRERPQHELQAQWASFATSQTAFAHASFYMVPANRHDITPSTLSNTTFALDAPAMNVCAVSDDVTSGVARRSMCAWYHVMSSSTDRYPRVLVEAHRPADCGHCLNGGSCAELTFPVAVLKKTGQCNAFGFSVYEGAWHDLVVGYACVASPEASSY